MANNIHWILERDINDSKSDDFKALMTEMVDFTKVDEPDALIYEWLSAAIASTAIYKNATQIVPRQ